MRELFVYVGSSYAWNVLCTTAAFRGVRVEGIIFLDYCISGRRCWLPILFKHSDLFHRPRGEPLARVTAAPVNRSALVLSRCALHAARLRLEIKTRGASPLNAAEPVICS